MHTKDVLAQALRIADLPDLADRAAQGLYHDFLNLFPLPAMALARDLLADGGPQAMAVLARHRAGEFDASEAEAAEWGRSGEAQALFARIREA